MGRLEPRARTGVDNDVLGEVAHVDKGFVADSALVGPDVVVVADVVGQLAGLHEPGGGHSCHHTPCPQGCHTGTSTPHPHCGPSPLPAALAHVGLLPCVLPHVGNEGAGLGEGFPADQALARLLPCGIP